MHCIRCKIEMKKGIAISPFNDSRTIAPKGYLTVDTVKIINVLKCPKCGHSDDGVININKCFAVTLSF